VKGRSGEINNAHPGGCFLFAGLKLRDKTDLMVAGCQRVSDSSKFIIRVLVTGMYYTYVISVINKLLKTRIFKHNLPIVYM
jgi:hypothetical protein